MKGSRMATISKAEKIVSAAAELFLRYGYARTTMGEIARAAHISRPTLYGLFPGKEEVFEAVVLDLNARRLGEIEESLRPLVTLQDRLFAALRLWLVQVYELKQTNPDARDMDDLTFPVVRKVYADLQDLVARLLVESGQSLPAEPADLSRLLVFAIRGLGVGVSNVQDFTALTKLQVEMLCKAVGNPSP